MEFSQNAFAAPTRTLTGLGTTTFTPGGSATQSLAANATVTFAQPAGKAVIRAMAATADASGTVLLQFTDGTNTWTAVTIAVSTTGGQAMAISDNVVFWQIHNNSATVAIAYWFSGFGLVQ